MESLKKYGITKPVLWIIFGTLVIAGTWYFLLFRVQQQDLSSTGERINTLEARIDETRNGLGDVGKVREAIDSLQALKKELQASVMPREQISGIIDHILLKGERSGIKFTSVEPATNHLFSSGGQHNEYIHVPVRMKLRAEYTRFGSFLSSLGELPFEFSVNQVEMIHTPEFAPQIEIILNTRVVLSASDSNRGEG